VCKLPWVALSSFPDGVNDGVSSALAESKTTFISVALNPASIPSLNGQHFPSCGWIPATRDIPECFPALWNWLSSYWRTDRADYFLKINAVNTQVTQESVYNSPAHTRFVSTPLRMEGGGQPGESTRRARSSSPTAMSCHPSCAHAPQLGSAAPWEVLLAQSDIHLERKKHHHHGDEVRPRPCFARVDASALGATLFDALSAASFLFRART
jgi:hypothetical protein